MYGVCETKDGFAVTFDGVTVIVSHDNYHLTIAPTHNQAMYGSIGFYEYYPMADAVLGILTNKLHHGKPSRLQLYHRNKMGRMLGKDMHHHWRILLTKVDQTVLQVQRAVFAATADYPWILVHHPEDIYSDKYIVRDIISYRAAALATKMTYYPGDMSNWMSMFADNGILYRSLTKTLMNFPGGIPSSMAKNFPLIRLPHPMTERAPLLLALAMASLPIEWQFMDIAYKATPAQIKYALKLLEKHTHEKAPFRRASSMGKLAWFIGGNVDKHNGNIVGLTEKAIKAHQNRQNLALEVLRQSNDYDNPVKNPPALPNNPNITFLDKVGLILEEGTQMNHCVGGYAKLAARGECYLFHVNYAETEATVQVDSQGNVVQSHGPNNCTNAASLYGVKELTKWGKTLRQQKSIPF